MKTYKMRALMTLQATADRPKAARGETFEASAQERLDLKQMKRAEDVEPTEAKPKGGAKA